MKHELVHRLRTEGRGLREIARHLGWGLHTVQRYDRAATWQELADGQGSAPRPSKLDPFKPYLDQHDSTSLPDRDRGNATSLRLILVTSP